MSFESVSESQALELLLLSDVTLSPGEVELGGETGICLSQIGLDFESWIFNKIGLVSSVLMVVNMLWSLLLFSSDVTFISSWFFVLFELLHSSSMCNEGVLDSLFS